ncbi:MAG: fatty acid desaturase, partial [Chitinophagaceae bacterium]
MTHADLLRRVEWKDLRRLTLRELLIENNLTIPWFLASMTLAYY